MGSRMDKYIDNETIPTRSAKNKELYKQIYNAYDDFENLVVPSNAREIDPSDLKKEITSKREYRDEISTNNTVIRKEKIEERQKKENDVYDINELLNKAVEEKKKPDLIEPELANEDYLKKLKLDNRRTNIEQVKEMYDDIKDEVMEEDESLMRTANLSLEILSDLKSDGDKTVVTAPIKEDEKLDDTNDFYSSTYKFSKRDFVDRDYDDGKDEEDEEEEDDDDDDDDGGGKFFFKILILIFGIMLIILVLLYAINYFNRV